MVDGVDGVDKQKKAFGAARRKRLEVNFYSLR